MDSNSLQNGVYQQHYSQLQQPPPPQQQQQQQQQQQETRQLRNDVHHSLVSRPPPLPPPLLRQEHQQYQQPPRHVQIAAKPREQLLHVQQPPLERVSRPDHHHHYPQQQLSLRSQELVSDEQKKKKRKEPDDKKQEDSVAAQKYQRRSEQPLQRNAATNTASTAVAKIDTGESFLPDSTLARSMRVDNMVVHLAPKTINENTTLFQTNNSIIDLVSYICANWKRQVDALALTPVEQLEFYNRQYGQLSDVLSIALFNKSSNEQQQQRPTLLTSVANANNASAAKSNDRPLITTNSNNNRQQEKTSRQKTKPSKQSHNSDYEIIVFVHGDQNRYLYRRVESAEKYAKRMKITCYIRIAVKDEDAKTIIAFLRTNDPTFVVGKEIRYNEGNSLSELHTEMIKRIDGMSLENKPKVELVVEEEKEEDEEEEAENEENVNNINTLRTKTAKAAAAGNAQEPPPAKKIKTSRNNRQPRTTVDRKCPPVVTKPKGGDVDFIGNNTRRSGVEMNTDIEDEYNDNNNDDDDDDDDDTTKGQRKEKEYRTKTNDNDNDDNKNSESDNNTTSDSDSNSSSGSSGSSSSSDDDDDDNNKNKNKNWSKLSHDTEEYIPTASNNKTVRSSPVPCYTPTPKTSSNRSYFDLPPSPLLVAAASVTHADVNMRCDKSPGSLFPDTGTPSHGAVVNRKRKHHH